LYKTSFPIKNVKLKKARRTGDASFFNALKSQKIYKLKFFRGILEDKTYA